jgi:hypothetical protein
MMAMVLDTPFAWGLLLVAAGAVALAVLALRRLDLGNDAKGLFQSQRVHASIGSSQGAVGVDFNARVFRFVDEQNIVRSLPFSDLEAVCVHDGETGTWMSAAHCASELRTRFALRKKDQLFIRLRFASCMDQAQFELVTAEGARSWWHRKRAQAWVELICSIAGNGQISSWGLQASEAS